MNLGCWIYYSENGHSEISSCYSAPRNFRAAPIESANNHLTGFQFSLSPFRHQYKFAVIWIQQNSLCKPKPSGYDPFTKILHHANHSSKGKTPKTEFCEKHKQTHEHHIYIIQIIWEKTRRVVDVVNGVVGAELPQVLLDPVVHQRLLELDPVPLHQEEQLVLPRD